jgi:hypothetical protein
MHFLPETMALSLFGFHELTWDDVQRPVVSLNVSLCSLFSRAILTLGNARRAQTITNLLSWFRACLRHSATLFSIYFTGSGTDLYFDCTQLVGTHLSKVRHSKLPAARKLVCAAAKCEVGSSASSVSLDHKLETTAGKGVDTKKYVGTLNAPLITRFSVFREMGVSR